MQHEKLSKVYEVLTARLSYKHFAYKQLIKSSQWDMTFYFPNFKYEEAKAQGTWLSPFGLLLQNTIG
jgi:hypothetical protein